MALAMFGGLSALSTNLAHISAAYLKSLKSHLVPPILRLSDSG